MLAMPHRLTPVIAACALLVCGARPAGDAQPPALPSLLSAAATYVAQYEERASAIVFEERYVQTLNRAGMREVAQRELRSELVVMKPRFTQVGI